MLCAFLCDIKTAHTFQVGNQNSQRAYWQQQQGRQAVVRSNERYQSYHNHFPTSTYRPFYGIQTTTTKNVYATKPPYAENVPLITDSPFKPNYGYAPATLSSSSKAVILKQEYERLPDGGYRFL